MNARLILVPIDFTPTSDAALETATTLARGSGGKLLIVHVYEPLQGATVDYLYAYPDLTPDEWGKKLAAVVPPETGVPYEHRLLNGTPVDAILALTDAEQVDLIVIGTHGRRGLGRLLMGSVAEAVVRRAKCPVLAVKAPVPAPVLSA